MPCELDRLPAKMAQICIERLASGYGQEYAAQNKQGKLWLRGQYADAIERIEGQKNFKMVGNVGDAHDTEDNEPDHRHRREQRGNSGGAMILEQKKRHQHGNSDWHDEWLKA